MGLERKIKRKLLRKGFNPIIKCMNKDCNNRVKFKGGELFSFCTSCEEGSKEAFQRYINYEVEQEKILQEKELQEQKKEAI